MQQVTVRVPASTSNIGPGFDCLGIALRISNQVSVSRGGKRGGSPMIQEAAADFFREAKRKPFAFSCAVDGEVPRSRGLGSSVTVRLGLLHGLNELSARPLRREQLFGICANLEGHPDNAAPAEWGGFVVVSGGRRYQFSVDARLHFILLIPNLEIPTDKARCLLPRSVPFTDAVENCANACAITAAFACRDYEKLRGAFTDHLHQPFRKKLIPRFDEVIAAAESAGALGAFLSGSGSTIAAVSLRSPEKIGSAMRSAFRSDGARVVVTSADNRGVRVLRREG